MNGTAGAQTQKSPLGIPLPQQQQAAPPVSAEPGAQSAGPLARMWDWIFATQSALNRDMASAIKNMKSENPLRAALILISIAFAYGVLHAAGPGHGKSVISAYVLTNKETVRRGIALSFLSALFQALSAILFVGIMTLVLQQTSLQMRSTEATIETVSWGLVATVGAYLLWRQIAPFVIPPQPAASSEHTHDHAHGPNCSCGHSHMPAPKDLQGAWSWKRALPLALSVGIRPCSGAILLLIFALSQGMLWAGVLGTFAMALGTAITVSILAALAVSSRDWAARASGPGSVWAERIQTAAGFAGAGLVFVLGSAFFIASLRGPG
ncbi:MAG: nickel/cobalt transporter, partial [Hyphomicrobium sp.]